MRHFIDTCDFTIGELDELIATADDILDHPSAYADACRGKKLASLFFEPSTRTRLSFEAAMYELGGQVLSVSGTDSSSASKGESVSDTARIVSLYADIIAMRHPREGAPLVATQTATVPVINAGDGGHLHPTQTLADLLTIHRECGRFEGLTVGLCGDLKFGRTVHSLIRALSRYEGVHFVLISPKELALPENEKQHMQKAAASYEECSDLSAALPALDVLYMTRIQRERFFDASEYERLKDFYILNTEKMKLAKKHMIVMHPLPRVNEISTAVDADPRAAYFRQAMYGKYIRMALILRLLSSQGESTVQPAIGQTDPACRCKNPRCILRSEQELLPRVLRDGAGHMRCAYCEADV